MKQGIQNGIKCVSVYVDYNDKQHWNKDKCRCECKELDDKGVYDKGFIFNPNNCQCECDQSCNIGEYLDYSNCKYRKNYLIS